jgi:uncharacterized protein (DUF1330 family)
MDISDQAAFQKAIADSNVAHKAHGGRYLVLGGQSTAIVGDAPKRFTIIQFDSFEQAQNWLKSPDYAPIQSAVGKSAKTRSFVIEGVAP